VSTTAAFGEKWQCDLVAGAADVGITLGPPEVAAFGVYLHLLLEHNPRAGLTAISDPARIAVKHFLDSLSGLLVHDIRAGERVADVGSGGGFPGLALAILRPAAEYLLIESVGKRAAFLELAARALCLPRVGVYLGRAEAAGRHPSHREAYHVVVSRAVAPLPVLLEYCLPLARVGGRVIAYKGPEADREVARSQAALAALGGAIAEVRSLSLPRRMGDRVLVVVSKTAPTPERYPRRAGVPSKRPVG
jgi:16S rRNA (guanine527-N7)-methyltransferase